MDSNQITPTTHLQGIGRVPAKPAQDLHAGDIIIWNFGYKSTVIELTPRGKTQVSVEMFNHDTAKRSIRVMSRTRLVGFTPHRSVGVAQ